jgi:hypothetical protein
VRPSAPPSASAYTPVSPVEISCSTSPPSRTRSARLPSASAIQTAPSASRHIPSGATESCPRASPTSVVAGTGPKEAQSRRSDSPPSASISKALIRCPNVSLTIIVLPVITAPFGKCSGSLATVLLPSGSTRTSGAGAIGAPAIRSKPKLPTQVRPRESTTMSLSNPPAWEETSACTLSAPSGSRRSNRWSRIETISSRPSGNHPSPDG